MVTLVLVAPVWGLAIWERADNAGFSHPLLTTVLCYLPIVGWPILLWIGLSPPRSPATITQAATEPTEPTFVDLNSSHHHIANHPAAPAVLSAAID